MIDVAFWWVLRCDWKKLWEVGKRDCVFFFIIIILLLYSLFLALEGVERAARETDRTVWWRWVGSSLCAGFDRSLAFALGPLFQNVLLQPFRVILRLFIIKNKYNNIKKIKKLLDKTLINYKIVKIGSGKLYKMLFIFFIIYSFIFFPPNINLSTLSL